MENLIITPKTKIYDLLESYPQLEDKLIEAAPAFKKLKNPVLRRTITRVTSLSQAAVIGGLKVEELINTLRKAAGQQMQDHYWNDSPVYNFEKPAWFSPELVKSRINIGDMLNSGEQPVHEVLSAIKRLDSGEILQISAPFIPAPLIDKATGLGYRHWIMEITPDDYTLFFSK